MCSKHCCCCASTGCCKNYSAMIAPRRVPSCEIFGNRYGQARTWQHHSMYREYWAQYNHLLVHFDRLVNPFSQPKHSSHLCGEEKPAKRSGGYPVRKNAFEQPPKRNSHSSKKHSRHEKGQKRPKKVPEEEVDEEQPSDYWKTRLNIDFLCRAAERKASGPSQKEVMQHIREWRIYEPAKKIRAWRVGDKERMEELYGKENAMKIIELLNAEDKAFQDCQNKKYVLWPVIPLKL